MPLKSFKHKVEPLNKKPVNKFLQKYKQVIMNAFILICLIFVSLDFGRDFFLGAASGAVLIRLGESIGNLRREKNLHRLTEEKILQ